MQKGFWQLKKLLLGVLVALSLTFTLLNYPQAQCYGSNCGTPTPTPTITNPGGDTITVYPTGCPFVDHIEVRVRNTVSGSIYATSSSNYTGRTPACNVYAYCAIGTNNINPSDIERVRYYVRVPNSWTLSRNVSYNTVDLYYYNGTAWVTVDASYSHSTGGYYYYVVELSSLPNALYAVGSNTQCYVPPTLTRTGIDLRGISLIGVGILAALFFVFLYFRRKRRYIEA